METVVHGYQISFEESGNPKGIPIVFLHGFPFNHTMWKGQLPPLEKEFRLLLYDHRGHGKTSVGDGRYTIEFLVDDLITLLDFWGIPQAVLCGLSMGGYVALRATERHPVRVKALVLCNTRSEADTNEAKVKRSANLRTLATEGVSVFAEGFLKTVFSPESFEKRPHVVEFVRRMINETSLEGITATLLSLASRTDTTESLSKIRVPTLILTGEQDSVIPIAASHAMKDRIANSEWHSIPDAGHLSNLENPEVFNQYLVAFLQKLYQNSSPSHDND